MINTFFNTYFGFNKQQRNGLLVLSIISFILLLIRITYPHFIKPDKIEVQNLPLIERKLDSNFIRENFQRTIETNKKKVDLFIFDPNTVSYDQLISLGFREKTAKTFLKYRERGFVFKEKKDMQKIYGVSKNFYSTLEPYLAIRSIEKSLPDKKVKLAIEEKKFVKPSQKIVDLNSCDSSALIQINGIGPSYARRILKYRDMLGGYISIEQLKEVYGFPEELYEKVKPYVIVNSTAVKKIHLNSDDFKTMNRHPYLSYELTKSIFSWRRKTTITAINLKTIINDETLYQKLMPYLLFD